MISGHSNQRGILFSDASAEGNNAVYCWRDGDSISYLTGPVDEMNKLFKDEIRVDKAPSERPALTRAMVFEALFMVALVICSVVFDGRPQVIAGAFVFAFIGSFPLLSLTSARLHEFRTDEMFEQLRRNHGAEHTVINYWETEKDHSDEELADLEAIEEPWNLDDIRPYSHFAKECGTVYMSSILIWAGITGASICFSAELGWLATGGIILGSAFVLFLNTLLNPLNPLKLLQKMNVAKPTDTELEVAATGLQVLIKTTAQNQQ